MQARRNRIFQVAACMLALLAAPSNLFIRSGPSRRAPAAPPRVLQAVARSVLVEVCSSGDWADFLAGLLLALLAWPWKPYLLGVSAVEVCFGEVAARPG